MKKIKGNDWSYSLDELDNFADLSHLTRMTVQKIEHHIPGCTAHMFVHIDSLHEYREEDKETAYSIPEDNPLVTYLALQNRILDRKNLADDPYFQDDKISSFIIVEQLEITTIIPLVHRFKLLGFIGISLPEGQDHLLKNQRGFVNALQKELLINLYAAQFVDKRFAELEILSRSGKAINMCHNLNELYQTLFTELSKNISFDTGLLWIIDNKNNQLVLKSSYGTSIQIPPLKNESSISGFIHAKGNPILIKHLPDHPFFAERNIEPGLFHSIISIPLSVMSHSVGVLTISSHKREFSGEDLHIASIFASFITSAYQSLLLYHRLEKGYFDTITALAAALDAKDPYTAGHSERVMHYATGIAEELDLPLDRIRLIRFAAILHDIGKIGISGDIIRKKGQLSPEEYDVIQKHPQIGEQIISAIEFLGEAKSFIKYHHERVDGQGYYKMPLEKIPREALILNMADAFDAMTSDRPYRKGYSRKEALKLIKKDIGTQFSEETFTALERYLERNDQQPLS